MKILHVDLEEPDEDLAKQATAIALRSGINILRSMDLAVVILDNSRYPEAEFKIVAGAAWIKNPSYGRTFSVDIVVDELYRNHGYGTKLLKEAMSLYEREIYDEGIEMYVVSPGGLALVRKLNLDIKDIGNRRFLATGGLCGQATV